MAQKGGRRVRSYPAPSPARASNPSQLQWELSITGDLVDKQNDLFERLVDVPRRSAGIIYFDSCGGSVYVGLSMAALIRLRGLKASGIVLGECSSAALFPFAACSSRFVNPHSTLLFHPIRWQSEEDIRLEEAAEWARHFKVLEKDTDDLLVQFFNCDRKLIQDWTHPGCFVTGVELAEAGLAHLIDLTSGDLWQQIAAMEQSVHSRKIR